MTYSSRGRSLVETILAAVFGGFLTGFILVLCIGNYYRAKRAMERQKQRRMARLSNGSGNAVLVDSPRSYPSSSTSAGSTPGMNSEQQHLLATEVVGSRRRTANNNNNPDQDHDRTQQTANLMSV